MSPMLKDSIWREILKVYKYIALERKRNRTIFFIPNYKDNSFRQERGGLYICYKCMEKALGRKLVRSDLNGSPFNSKFINFYFMCKDVKEKKQPTKDDITQSLVDEFVDDSAFEALEE